MATGPLGTAEGDVTGRDSKTWSRSSPLGVPISRACGREAGEGGVSGCGGFGPALADRTFRWVQRGRSRNEGASEGGGQGGLGGEDRQCGVRRGARWRRVVHIRPGFATSRSELSGSTQPFTTLRDSGQGSGQGAAGVGGGRLLCSVMLGLRLGKRPEAGVTWCLNRVTQRPVPAGHGHRRPLHVASPCGPSSPRVTPGCFGERLGLA